MNRDSDPSALYPVFGPDIDCPHCGQTIPALILTDSYLCSRHGVFEANPETQELLHVQSQRRWRRWEGRWYRQHTHPDGIRFEIHTALDRLYTQGYRATRVIIADRYQTLLANDLDRRLRDRDPNDPNNPTPPRLYGLPVQFSPSPTAQPCWQTINFELDREVGAPVRYPDLQT